jgi:flagellar basal-body rod protein FlgB
MINGIFDNSTIPALGETIHFAQARHNLLAGNIANLDTPGYKTRDLSIDTFQAKLAEAIQTQRERGKSLSLGVMSDERDEMRHVHESMESLLRHDDVNVGMEQQVREMSKNSYLHNLAISVMSSQFRLLQAMISERA